MEQIIDINPIAESSSTSRQPRMRDSMRISKTHVIMLVVDAMTSDKNRKRRQKMYSSFPCMECSNELDRFSPVNSETVVSVSLVWRKSLSEIVFALEAYAWKAGIKEEFFRTNFIGEPENMKFTLSSSPAAAADILIGNYLEKLSDNDQFKKFFTLCGCNIPSLVFTDSYDAIDSFSVSYDDMSLFLKSGLDGTICIGTDDNTVLSLRKKGPKFRFIWETIAEDGKKDIYTSAWAGFGRHGDIEEIAKSLLESVFIRTGSSVFASCGGKNLLLQS